MWNIVIRFGKIVAGVFLILLGILGLILPVLPGWIFIGIGGSLISKRFDIWLRRMVVEWKIRLQAMWMEFQKEEEPV